MGLIKNAVDRHREAVLYVIFGGFTTLVTWASYAIFVWFGMDLNLSNILSWVCGVLFAFAVNKWFVFSCRSTELRVIVRELGSFFGARIFTGIIAFILFPILLAFGIDYLFGVEGFYAKAITSVIEIALNYVFSKYLIFTKKTVKEIVCEECSDPERKEE